MERGIQLAHGSGQCCVSRVVWGRVLLPSSASAATHRLLGGRPGQGGCLVLQVQRQMRHAHIDMARTPAEKVCVPLAVDSHATSDCIAPYTWVAACPHGATRLSTYMCTNMQTAAPMQDLAGSHLCASSCRGCRSIHSYVNIGAQAHTYYKYSPLPSASVHSQVEFLSGVSTL